MENKICILKNKLVTAKIELQQELEEIKKVPEYKRQDSSLYFKQGELCAIDIILNMIEEL